MQIRPPRGEGYGKVVDGALARRWLSSLDHFAVALRPGRFRSIEQLFIASERLRGVNGQAMRGVFRLEGEYWTVVYEGQVRRFRNRRGFELLAELLRQPGRRILALELDSLSGRHPCLEPDLLEAAERARINVTRAIKDAIGRIRMHHPEFAVHLDATIRTGALCTYQPDPRLPMKWEVVDRQRASQAA